MNRFILPGYSGDLVNLEQMHFPKISKLNTNNSTNRKPQFTRAALIPEPANIDFLKTIGIAKDDIKVSVILTNKYEVKAKNFIILISVYGN